MINPTIFLLGHELSQLITNGGGGGGTTLSHSNTTTSINVGVSGVFQVEIDESIKRRIDEKLRECSSGDSDSDSEHNIYMPKAVDLPSAQRLAKRLYYLDGFKLNDVVRHLSKKLVVILVLTHFSFLNNYILIFIKCFLI